MNLSLNNRYTKKELGKLVQLFSRFVVSNIFSNSFLYYRIVNLVLSMIPGLNHEQNIKKMRILSFMQMAETNPDITFDEIINELQIEDKDVEAFIIEGSFFKFLYIVLFTSNR